MIDHAELCTCGDPRWKHKHDALCQNLVCRCSRFRPKREPLILTFVPRFVDPKDLAELSNLWHLSRVAAQHQPGTTLRYCRLIWAAGEFAKAHPAISATAAYKDLCDMIEFGGR